MDYLLRRFRSRNSGWRATDKLTWAADDGRKIVLRDDAVVCVSTLENEIMHKLAVKRLDLYYRFCARTCPDRSRILGLGVVSNFFKSVENKLHSSSRRHNIFGLNLETTIMLERRRQGYEKPRINNQYNLHVPYFVIESVKCIELFGLEEDGIFERCDDPFRLFQMINHLSTGKELKFDINSDVYEMGTLLKLYLRKMSEGLFTEALEYHFTKTTEFGVLPRANRETLFLLFSLLHQISVVRSNKMSSRKLNDVFSPVLFRYQRFVNEKSMGVIETLIDYFPMIFTLKANYLDHIYKTIVIENPGKLDKYLQRRISQCYCDASDIPQSLRILPKQRRGLDRSNVSLHDPPSDRGGLTAEAVEQHNHEFRRTLYASHYFAMLKRNDQMLRTQSLFKEFDQIRDIAQEEFPGFEIADSVLRQVSNKAREDNGHIGLSVCSTELRQCPGRTREYCGHGGFSGWDTGLRKSLGEATEDNGNSGIKGFNTDDRHSVHSSQYVARSSKDAGTRNLANKITNTRCSATVEFFKSKKHDNRTMFIIKKLNFRKKKIN